MEHLPREVLVAIDRVLSPEGSFRSKSPNVSESLNQLFPDGQSAFKWPLCYLISRCSRKGACRNQGRSRNVARAAAGDAARGRPFSRTSEAGPGSRTHAIDPRTYFCMYGTSLCHSAPCSTELQDLLTQMIQIREKATESEAIVRNITKEIQMLDTAKKNLTLSMTALKRFQMLGAWLVSNRNYILTILLSQCPRTTGRSLER
jgi:hypothetical protein